MTTGDFLFGKCVDSRLGGYSPGIGKTYAYGFYLCSASQGLEIF